MIIIKSFAIFSLDVFYLFEKIINYQVEVSKRRSISDMKNNLFLEILALRIHPAYFVYHEKFNIDFDQIVYRNYSKSIAQRRYYGSNNQQLHRMQSNLPQKLIKLQEALAAKTFSADLYNKYSIIPQTDPDLINFTEKLTKLFTKGNLNKEINFNDYLELNTFEARGVASMLGCGIADALGASSEFIPFKKDRHNLIQVGFQQIRKKILFGILNHRGKIGVWTDDCSMALCLADSILVKNFQFDPLDLRYRFMLWMDYGLNNGGRPYSIGLGGNIAISMREFELVQNPYTAETDKFNNGNGSIMRLCPAAIGYHDDVVKAMDVAGKQSKTTHNGDQASQCCRLLAKILVDLLHREESVTPKDQILQSCNQFQTPNKSVQYLSKSEMQTEQYFQQLSKTFPKFKLFNKTHTKDRDWNWKSKDFTYSEFRAKDQPGYVGSYCMDAMAMALHIVYHTSSFYEAVLWSVNMGGDCDSVGSVVGQMAGAMYGIDYEMMKLYSHMVDSREKRYHLFIKGYKLVTKQGVKEE